eukprot:jgi/Chrzof1/11325/Cz05g32160.t1
MGSTSPHAPNMSGAETQQDCCKGLLVYRQLTASADETAATKLPPHGHEAVCIGVSRPSSSLTPFDLARYHTSIRSLDLADSVLQYYCVGSSTYQRSQNPHYNGPNSKASARLTPSNSSASQSHAATQAPPSFCVGFEYLRYKQKLVQEVHQTIPSRPSGVIVHPSMPERTSSSTSKTGAAQPTNSQAPRGSSGQTMSDAPGQTPSASSRLHQMLLEVEKRLSGKDPLWFAKAFWARSQVNWAAMQSTASKMYSAAVGDIEPEDKDETC